MAVRDTTTQGFLYVVSTPIGNLEDITLRALRVLKEVYLIAAEDTRKTKKLLRAYGIQTPLISLYDHNERKRSRFLMTVMNEGKDVAYVSEAGTPGISDPGYVLINEAIRQTIRVIPVPGASAVIAALSVSGLPMDHFLFYGFLPAKSAKRRQILEILREETRTMIFYESPLRLFSSLDDLESILGNRRIVIARELTKMYEEILRGPLRDVRQAFHNRSIKGEITLIISGMEKKAASSMEESIGQIYDALKKNTDLTLRDIISRIAEESGLSRHKVYSEVIRRSGMREET